MTDIDTALPLTEDVDLGRLGDWMDSQGLEQGPLGDVRRLAGGTQNIILRFRRDDREFVLRRPPANPRPGNDETMRREARLLAALATTAVPHPALIAACGEIDVLGAAFYLMEPIDGFNAVNGLPSPHAADRAMRREMGFALVDGAAALGAIDHLALGLDDFGKPGDFLARQVERWQKQLAGYGAEPRWPGRSGLPGLDDVADFLVRRCPADYEPGILHGDYTIGNVLYRPDAPGLAAIVDWELATIGDPLIDLGTIVATWRGEGPELPVLKVEPWDGFPTARELIERYAQASRRDLSAINWYVALACYRLAIILEGSFVRALDGRVTMEIGERLHETAVRLMARALPWID